MNCPIEYLICHGAIDPLPIDSSHFQITDDKSLLCRNLTSVSHRPVIL